MGSFKKRLFISLDTIKTTAIDMMRTIVVRIVEDIITMR